MRTFFIILTTLFFGLGVFFAALVPGLIDDAYQREADKASAREAGPPWPERVEAFDPRNDVALADEATLIAQIPAEGVVAQPSRHTRWLAPLLATTETDPNAAPIGYAAHPSVAWSGETEAWRVRGPGPAGGQIVEINGVIVDPYAHRAALDRAAGDADLASFVIEPFLGGRDAALARDEDAIVSAYFGILSPILAFGFAAFCYAATRVARLREALVRNAETKRTMWRR